MINQKKISEKYKFIDGVYVPNKKPNNYAKNFGYNSLFIIWNLILIFTSTIASNYYYFIGLIIDIFIIVQLYFVYKYYYNLLIESNEKVNTISNNFKNNINKIKDEIKKLEESTMSLDNWICEI